MPVKDRSVDLPLDIDQPKRFRTPHYSLDTEIEFEYSNEPIYEPMEEEQSFTESSPAHHLFRDRNKRDMMLDRTEQQIRNLLISSPVKQQSQTQTYKSLGADDVLDRSGNKMYDLEKASKSYFDDSTTTETLKR